MTEQLVTFPHGLVGCEGWKHFVRTEVPDEPIQQLVCLDEPGIAFLTVPVEALVPDYQLDLNDADERVLECHGSADMLVLCTLTTRRQRPMLTANLVGPLVINRATGIAKQVVLVNSSYSLKHPVLDVLPGGAHARPH